MVDQDLLMLLACPQCRGELRLLPEEEGLVCEPCRLLYAIREGVPVLLVSEAVKLE